MTLSATGYDARDLNEVMDDLRTAAKLTFGDDINTSASSKLGGLLGVFAEAIADVEKASQALYDAFNRSNAVGQQLDNLANIIGLERLPAVQATALVTLGGTGGVPVPAGSIVANTSGDQFTVVASAVVGDTGVVVRAIQFGDVDVTLGTISVIVTAITGWDTVTNPAAGASGRDRETDAELRARMADAPSTIGACTVEAIKDDLQQALPTALGVVVIENVTDLVDVNGLQPHSFRAILYPNTLDTATIGSTLWLGKPAGIATDGSESIAVIDSMGISHAMLWDWAVDFEVEVAVVLTGIPVGADYPGDTAVQDAVQDVIDALDVGADVTLAPLVCAISAIAGVNDVAVTYREKGVGGYISTPLAVAINEKPIIALIGDITVAS